MFKVVFLLLFLIFSVSLSLCFFLSLSYSLCFLLSLSLFLSRYHLALLPKYNGINYTTSGVLGNLPLGAVLQLTASAPGFDPQTKNVTLDNADNTFYLQITFLLSAILVSKTYNYF